MKAPLKDLTSWIATKLSLPTDSLILEPIQGDASFRQYYRLKVGEDSRVVMVSPPDIEPAALESFISVSNILHKQGITVPEVLFYDLSKGFALLTDLGDELLLDNLDSNSVDKWYSLAIDNLIKLNNCDLSGQQVPTFDENLYQTELGLFKDWFCKSYMGINLCNESINTLNRTFDFLIDSALSQPQVFTHRDFHSRNLMCMDNDLGVIDFQDAVVGPVTYDLVSLLKDCYVSWPDEKIQSWALAYYNSSPKCKNTTKEEFLKYFDLIGLQRHLKVLGIFARLHLRDNKPRYLKDMPRILSYILPVLDKYSELSDFREWMNNSRIVENAAA